MNLVVDIGNTFCKVALFEKGKEVYSGQQSNFNMEYCRQLKEKNPETKNIIVSSVAKNNIDERIFSLFENSILVDENTSLPIKVKYETGSTLGKDRLAAAVGAYTLFPHDNLLVIDAGTAITFDFVSKEGIYCGGNISPGLNTRFKSLHHFTGRLPLVTHGENDLTLTARSTKQAIASGVYFGMIYEIHGYMNDYKTKYGNLKTILTGGDANNFAEKLKNSIFVVFNLNLIGLNRILEYNVIED